MISLLIPNIYITFTQTIIGGELYNEKKPLVSIMDKGFLSFYDNQSPPVRPS